MTVFEILNALASDNSRLAKEAILRSNKDNKDLQRVFKLALDPLISYYIRKIPAYTASGNKNLPWAMEQLENQFATRNVTGNAAIELLTNVLESLNEADASVIAKIISKDLRCGVSEATVNKIWPGLVSSYPVMLASGFDQKLVDKIIFPAFCQLKLDGMRFNAIVRNNKVEYRSRNGKELNIPNKLFDATFIELATIYGSDVVFDGELLVADQSGNPLERKTGNGILSKGVKGTMSEKEALCVRATLWDYIPYEDFTKGIYTKENYTTRLANLNFMLVHLNVNKTQLKHYTEVVYTKEVKTQQEATSLFEKFLSEGQEGTILKSKTGIWEDKRSKDQIKFKGELECDLRIVDWEEGTGRNKGRLGALVCESEDGKIRVNVGSGYKDDERDNFSKAMIGQIATVKYNARIKDRSGNVESLFLPTFIELRLDKDIADYSKAIK